MRRSVIGLPASAALPSSAEVVTPQAEDTRARPAAKAASRRVRVVRVRAMGGPCRARGCAGAPTLAAPVSVVTIAVSTDVVVIVVTDTRGPVGAILCGVATSEKRRTMTLAGQYLLLQVLIVLVVLLAVGAISVAQTARAFERSEVRPGAERSREPGRHPDRAPAPRHGDPGPTGTGDGRRGVAHHVRVHVGVHRRLGRRRDQLLRPHPGRPPCAARRRAGCCRVPRGRATAKWPGTRRSSRRPRCTPSSPAGWSGWSRSAGRCRRSGAASVTWSPTCSSTSASPASSDSAVPCCCPAG